MGSRAPGPPTSYLGGIRAPKPKAENLLSLEERRPHHTGSTVSLGVGCFGTTPTRAGTPIPPLPRVAGPALNHTGAGTRRHGALRKTPSLQTGTEPTPSLGPEPDPGNPWPPVFGTSALCHPPPYRGVDPSLASVYWSVKWATLHVCVKGEGDHVRKGQPHLSTWGILSFLFFLRGPDCPWESATQGRPGLACAASPAYRGPDAASLPWAGGYSHDACSLGPKLSWRKGAGEAGGWGPHLS